MKLRKTLAILLTLSVFLCTAIISTNAAIPPRKIGDVNNDSVVNVTDATAIQRHLSKIEYIYEGFYGYSEAADVNSDAKITILDATVIQQYVASIITKFPAGEEYGVDKYFYDLHTDYDSSKAMAGIPVTFYVRGYCSPSPTTVKLYVNEELVAQTQEVVSYHNYEISYTFEEAGTYQIRVFMCDKWGFGINKTIEDYVVIDTPQDTSKPIITGVYRNNSNNPRPEITAIAKFGKAPYQYKFRLFIYSTDEAIQTQDYSDSNKFQVDFGDRFPIPREFSITVDVKDAAGNTVSETYSFVTESVDPA